MKSVVETLAGRVGIISLQGFTLRKIYDKAYHQPFVPTEEFLSEVNIILTLVIMRYSTCKKVRCQL